MRGRHRRTAGLVRRHRPRHRKPPPRSHVLAPAGLALVLLAGGSLAIAHAASNGGVTSGSLSGGLVLAVPSAAPPPNALAFAGSLPPTAPAQQQAPAAHRHHRASLARHRAHPPVALRIADTGPACYVQVTRSGGRVLISRVIHGHRTLTFPHRGLDVVLGNAGAVRIAIAGRHAHRAGRSGQVRRFHVG